MEAFAECLVVSGSLLSQASDLPWAEQFATSRPEPARLAAEFGAAVRRTSSLMQLMGQAATDRIGLNATDLNRLNILSFSGQMTADELARATGLTTASITGVAHRLEEAGYVRRGATHGTAAVWSSAWCSTRHSATLPRYSCRWSATGRRRRPAVRTTSCG